MFEDDSKAVNPKPIISLMYAVSVGFWAKELDRYVSGDVQDGKVFQGDTESWIILGSGLLFLIDLMCIVWWYARYIYRIQPTASFGTYFLDFVICSMFALASNSWTNPTAFLFATLCGSAFLALRFWRLFNSPDASLTDRRIMSLAAIFLAVSMLIALVGLSALTQIWKDLAPALKWDGHALPGTLALVGIILTVWMRTRIDVAVDIYSASHSLKGPSPLIWPKQGTPNQEQRERIRDSSIDGLVRFEELFAKFGKHDRVRSRVHAETDLRIQSFILAVPSCEREEFTKEIKQKAFMVAVSHWLDDLVDGRNEDTVARRITDGPKLSAHPDEAVELFNHIYRPLIIKYTDRKFFANLVGEISAAAIMAFNKGSLFLGLNRVAYGAVIFSPRIRENVRLDILRDHNVFLKDWNVEHDAFTNSVEAIINEMSAGREVGGLLLGLTTKTVQEIAMSSENYSLNVGLSILYSILYAPLIYYHNIIDEVEYGEMIALEAFDTDYDLWIPWLEDTRKAIDDLDGEMYAEDVARKHARARQAEMVYQCFESKLPRVIEEQMRDIYCTKPVEQ